METRSISDEGRNEKEWVGFIRLGQAVAVHPALRGRRNVKGVGGGYLGWKRAVAEEGRHKIR
jgi:hypothetical protein